MSLALWLWLSERGKMLCKRSASVNRTVVSVLLALKNKILTLYHDYLNDDLKVASKNIDQFHRKQLTQQLATIIKSL